MYKKSCRNFLNDNRIAARVERSSFCVAKRNKKAGAERGNCCPNKKEKPKLLFYL